MQTAREEGPARGRSRATTSSPSTARSVTQQQQRHRRGNEEEGERQRGERDKERRGKALTGWHESRSIKASTTAENFYMNGFHYAVHLLKLLLLLLLLPVPARKRWCGGVAPLT